MNKKKIGTGLLALGLVAVVGIGGSLAWFTDQQNVTNKFETGFIDASIKEEGPDGETTEGIEYEDIQPGDKLDKKVTVSLEEDSGDAWVRLVLTLTSDNAVIVNSAVNGEILLLDENEQPINITWTAEEDENGKTYAKAILDTNVLLTAGGEWVPFYKVEVPESWGNDEAKAKFELDVKAQAIQATHNDDGFAGVTEDEIQTFDK